MADLEKTIDTPENSGETNVSNTWNDFNLDFSEPLTPDSNLSAQENTQPDISQIESEPTVSEVMAENSVENGQVEPLNSFPEERINETSVEDTVVQEPLEAPSENTTTNVVPDSLEESQPSLQSEEIPAPQDTNDSFLWSFENNMTNPTNNGEIQSSIDNSTLLNHPAILDNPFSDSNNKEEDKNKLVQKEKLAHLIKAHESKAQKSWFLKWILSGVVAMIVIAFVSFIFAKDQVIDMINMINEKTPWLSANVVEITDSQNEEVGDNEENIIDNEIEDENIDNENEYNNDDEFEDNELEENYIDQENIEDVDEISDVEYSDFEDEENINEYDNSEDIESYSEDTEEINNFEENESANENQNLRYNITRVDSEEEANWVLPSHCSDLTCYGDDKEFTPCTTFRLSENLDENANRIGKNWTCKYKDASELVYVEFN